MSQGMQSKGPIRLLTFHGNTVECRCNIAKAFDHLLRILTNRTITVRKCHEHTDNNDKFEKDLNEIMAFHLARAALVLPCSRLLDTKRIEWPHRLTGTAFINSRIPLLQ